MTYIHKNLSWILFSIVIAIALIISWFISFGVVVNLLFLLIGFAATYFIQTRTQDRAWKREYAVKIAEEIYGNLFRQMKNIIECLEKKYYIYWISFEAWRDIQESHKYYMVSENFRKRFDNFYERLERYTHNAVGLGSEVRKIVIEETERAFGKKVREIPNLGISYTKEYSRIGTNRNLIECIVSETHPRKTEPDASDIELTLTITSIDNQTTQIHESKEFDDFWQSCLRRMKESEIYKLVTEENRKVLALAKIVREEIVKAIGEPWKI